jgi:hypothetical protein
VNGLSMEQAAQRWWQASLWVTGPVQYHADTGALEPRVDPQLETLHTHSAKPHNATPLGAEAADTGQLTAGELECARVGWAGLAASSSRHNT